MGGGVIWCVTHAGFGRFAVRMLDRSSVATFGFLSCGGSSWPDELPLGTLGRGRCAVADAGAGVGGCGCAESNGNGACSCAASFFPASADFRLCREASIDIVVGSGTAL